jgi:hypothetical protein
MPDKDKKQDLPSPESIGAMTRALPVYIGVKNALRTGSKKKLAPMALVNPVAMTATAIAEGTLLANSKKHREDTKRDIEKRASDPVPLQLAKGIVNPVKAAYGLVNSYNEYEDAALAEAESADKLGKSLYKKARRKSIQRKAAIPEGTPFQDAVERRIANIS